MCPLNNYEREEDFLSEQLINDEIDVKEYNLRLKMLERTYSRAAEEAAQDAYDREMEQW